jgi:formate--tetrahydrofolate ligase
MGLERRGRRALAALRQSSLGPVFGIKGGGAGGGRAKVIPLEESILHLTGDIHAIGQAHNQLAAMTDNAWYHGTPPCIDPARIRIRRVMDVNDRFLRHVTIGQGDAKDGMPRATGFDITVASELMAILALVDGRTRAEVVRDLRARIGRMVVAFDSSGRPITAEDVQGAGAAAVLMRDTIKPTLMQTAEHTPVFLHAGPFGNIAHGCSSILADRIGLRFADYVVTEAGFGMDLGGEKFFDIKCRTSGLRPDAAVMVATLRALKCHSGRFRIVPGKPLPLELLAEDPEAVLDGGANLRKQLENLRQFGVPAVVALNAFPGDHASEIDAVRRLALDAGAEDLAVCTAFAEGGAGALELADKVIAAAERAGGGALSAGGPGRGDLAPERPGEGARPAERPEGPPLLYPADAPIRDKVDRVATTLYGAAGVTWSEAAAEEVGRLEAAGFGGLPICMARTHLSLSHDPKLKGAPAGFMLPIREVRVSAGAGFVTVYAGDIMTMPGLGADPAGCHIDLDENGEVVGLF